MSWLGQATQVFWSTPEMSTGWPRRSRRVLNMSSGERDEMGRRGRAAARRRAHPDVAARDAVAAYQTILRETR